MGCGRRPLTDPGEVRTVFRETVRTARYHCLGAEPSEARHICFVLHGYGQLAARILRHFAGIIPDGVCVVAPEALNRFYTVPLSRDGSHMERVGATWLTREDREHEIADALRWLDSVHAEVVPTHGSGALPTTSIIGFSQGVATAMRWIMRGAVRPAHFVIWAGSLATDMDQQEFGRTMTGVRTTFVSGTDDEYVPPERIVQLRAHLESIGITPDVRGFDGGHHLERGLLREVLANIVDQKAGP